MGDNGNWSSIFSTSGLLAESEVCSVILLIDFFYPTEGHKRELKRRELSRNDFSGSRQRRRQLNDGLVLENVFRNKTQARARSARNYPGNQNRVTAYIKKVIVHTDRISPQD